MILGWTTPRLPRWRHTATLLAFCLCVTPARAQTLSIDHDRFAIDGTPQFLVFISYFGAMGAPRPGEDLHLLRHLGFHGVRIWPNLDTGVQLMNGDGTLRPDGLARLRSILDAARHERMVVDVTFTYNHIPAMTPATARRGIAAATEALRSYRNLLFDIQNERNVKDERYMSEADVRSIFVTIKGIDPTRIVTASNSIGDESGPQYAADFTSQLGLDVVAFHEARRADWYRLDVYTRVVQTLQSAARPVYLQEPNGARNPAYPANDRATYFRQALANAKRAGAAAWCFHTHAGTDFRTGPPLFEDRLRANPEPEWTFVTSLKR